MEIEKRENDAMVEGEARAADLREGYEKGVTAIEAVVEWAEKRWTMFVVE